MIIAFTGNDGSGKTSLAIAVGERFVQRYDTNGVGISMESVELLHINSHFFGGFFVGWFTAEMCFERLGCF